MSSNPLEGGSVAATPDGYIYKKGESVSRKANANDGWVFDRCEGKVSDTTSNATEITMKAHEIDYKIIGDDIQLVEVELDPKETVIAEAGAMLYMEEGISFETKLGDGSTPDQGFLSKVFSAGSTTRGSR